MSDDARATSRMPKMTAEQKVAFDAAQRSLECLAARIVALPLEERDQAIAAAGKWLQNTNREKGHDSHPATRRWLNDYMATLRARVSEIAASVGRS
jgi:hypothetical protein